MKLVRAITGALLLLHQQWKRECKHWLFDLLYSSVFLPVSAGHNGSLLRALGRRYFAASTEEYAKRNYANNASEYNTVVASLTAQRRLCSHLSEIGLFLLLLSFSISSIWCLSLLFWLSRLFSILFQERKESQEAKLKTSSNEHIPWGLKSFDSGLCIFWFCVFPESNVKALFIIYLTSLWSRHNLLRDVYDDMMLDGVQPTRDVFHSLIVGTMKGARMQDAFYFRDQMKAMGLLPDVCILSCP